MPIVFVRSKIPTRFELESGVIVRNVQTTEKRRSRLSDPWSSHITTANERSISRKVVNQFFLVIDYGWPMLCLQGSTNRAFMGTLRWASPGKKSIIQF